METGKSTNKIGWQMGAELGVRLTADADSYVGQGETQRNRKAHQNVEFASRNLKRLQNAGFEHSSK